MGVLADQGRKVIIRNLPGSDHLCSAQPIAQPKLPIKPHRQVKGAESAQQRMDRADEQPDAGQDPKDLQPHAESEHPIEHERAEPDPGPDSKPGPGLADRPVGHNSPSGSSEDVLNCSHGHPGGMYVL